MFMFVLLLLWHKGCNVLIIFRRERTRKYSIDIMQGYKPIKVICYNVNGLGNPIKRSKIMAKLKREEVEVALLQETHLSDPEHEKLKRWRFSQYSSSCMYGAKRRVTILISSKLNFECTYEKKDRIPRHL